MTSPFPPTPLQNLIQSPSPPVSLSLLGAASPARSISVTSQTGTVHEQLSRAIAILLDQNDTKQSLTAFQAKFEQFQLGINCAFNKDSTFNFDGNFFSPVVPSLLNSLQLDLNRGFK